MKRIAAALLLLTMLLSLAACGQSTPAETKAPETEAPAETTAAPETEAPETTPTGYPEGAVEMLPDGVYSVNFDTDSSMFHINESLDGKGTLTVADGKMTVHITLVSKSILKLFAGLAEDAQKDGAVWLEPTEDEVTYADGYTETVYGFDVPVEVIGAEFPLALIGKKGTWYDHMVMVSNPVLIEE